MGDRRFPLLPAMVAGIGVFALAEVMSAVAIPVPAHVVVGCSAFATAAVFQWRRGGALRLPGWIVAILLSVAISLSWWAGPLPHVIASGQSGLLVLGLLTVSGAAAWFTWNRSAKRSQPNDALK